MPLPCRIGRGAMRHGSGQIAARDARLGLQGHFGALFMGNLDTPYTSSTKGYDPSYPTTGGHMALMGNGAAATTDNVENTSSFDRTAVYAYYSRINNRSNAAYDFAINGVGVHAGADPQTFALGMRHNF